jgi:anti-sigma factor RsiW
VDCSEYISQYLAAQADDQLSAPQRRAVDDHLVQCTNCRALLAEERALKSLIRSHAGLVRTPPDVRLRIRAALGEVTEVNFERRPSSMRPTATGDPDQGGREGYLRHGVSQLSHPRLWTAVGGVAATLLIMLAIFAAGTPIRVAAKPAAMVPAFDHAIDRYQAFQREFASNLPPEVYSNTGGAVYAWVQDGDPVRRVASETADRFDDVARAYREMSMPDDLLDLSPAGYSLSGARAERLPDGRPVTYTLYTSAGGTILNICYPDSAMAAPVGAVGWLGMRSFYEYKGYSICMSFYPAGHFVSILLSQMPVRQMLADVATADAADADQ